jgi:hypothetical protein
MPEFILDTSGSVRETRDNPPRFYPSPCLWADLDAFTQGYIEALFFTENEPGTDRLTRLADLERWREGVERGEHKDIPGDAGFSDLAPEALARSIDDCAKFQSDAAVLLAAAYGRGYDEAQAGRDFWYTRNGHGVGYWDREALENDSAEYERLKDEMVANRDNPARWNAACAQRSALKAESLGERLTTAAKAFGEVDAYLGDDGKVHLS